MGRLVTSDNYSILARNVGDRELQYKRAKVDPGPSPGRSSAQYKRGIVLVGSDMAFPL